LAQLIVAGDGLGLYSPTDAGKLLGKSDSQIRRMADKGEVRTSKAPENLRLVQGPGRRPTYLVYAEDVDARRKQLLADLGVLEELTDLERQLSAARSAWETEADALRSRIAELESANASLLDAVDQRLAATIAQSEADRQFLRSLRVLGAEGQSQ
jgi:hypothetical protein